MTAAFLLLSLAVPGAAQAPRPLTSAGSLCREAGAAAGCLPTAAPAAATPSLAQGTPCPEDWRARRRGGCWAPDPVKRGARVWVHPRGWVVEPGCLDDARFSGGRLADALSAAWAKLGPGVPVASGGCLAAFNPAWGARLADSLWEREVRIACPRAEPEDKRCGTHHEAAWLERGVPRDRSVIELRSVERCSGQDGTGLAGVLFHETLHAAGDDSLPTLQHNAAWELPQYKFVRDRVYGAEAVCFFGVDRRLRGRVNFLQCRETVTYRAESPRLDLCADFDASFHDRPAAGFLKH